MKKNTTNLNYVDYSNIICHEYISWIKSNDQKIHSNSICNLY